MHVTCVFVQVKPDAIGAFIEATTENHNASIQEPENLRFDLLQSRENPSHFMIYEAYASDDAAAAHKETPHYLKWRQTVADWMAHPREGKKYDIVCPLERGQW